MSAIVTLTDVTVEYPAQSGKVLAVQNVSLEIQRGEMLMVVGASGCGKSTLLNVLAGLVTPTRGAATFQGRPITGPSRDRAVVFQDYLLFPWRNVWNNVAFGFEVGPRAIRQKVDPTAARDAIREAIELVGLSGFERHYPHQLSGGMRQRVGLARALVLNPTLLLMDEPFGAIDAITREVMQAELARIIERTGCTVFFITHSIDEALLLGDRVVVMSPRPGHVRAVLDVPLPKPRWSEGVKASPSFYELREHVWEMLRGDVAVRQTS